MEEKCYRELQFRGEIGGVSLIELFALVAVPVILFPVFTALDLSFLFILIIEMLMFAVFRLASKVSPFEYGIVSFFGFSFLWPRKMSAYRLDEREYLSQKKE